MARPGRPPGWELLDYTHDSSFSGYARDEQQRLSEQRVTGAPGECLSQSSPDGISVSYLREQQDHSPKSKTWLLFVPHHNPHLSVIPFRALLMLEGRCYSHLEKCKGPSNWSLCPWCVNRISFHKHQSWHYHGLKSQWLSMASDIKPKTPSYHLSSSILTWILLFSWISTGLQMPGDAPFSPAFPDMPSPVCELPLCSHHPFLNLRLQSHCAMMLDSMSIFFTRKKLLRYRESISGFMIPNDCSHEIFKKMLVPWGEKAMTNLNSVWKSRDITLPTKVHIVKAMVFPVVMYRWRSRTIKAEHWRIDAFKLWC